MQMVISPMLNVSVSEIQSILGHKQGYQYLANKMKFEIVVIVYIFFCFPVMTEDTSEIFNEDGISFIPLRDWSRAGIKIYGYINVMTISTIGR